jgi:hypothetical protein
MRDYRPDGRTEEQRVYDAAAPVLLSALASERITLAEYRSAIDVLRPKVDDAYSRRLTMLLLEGV